MDEVNIASCVTNVSSREDQTNSPCVVLAQCKAVYHCEFYFSWLIESTPIDNTYNNDVVIWFSVKSFHEGHSLKRN